MQTSENRGLQNERAARAATGGMNVESGAGPALPFKTPVPSKETGEMNAAGKRNRRNERLGVAKGSTRSKRRVRFAGKRRNRRNERLGTPRGIQMFKTPVALKRNRRNERYAHCDRRNERLRERRGHPRVQNAGAFQRNRRNERRAHCDRRNERRRKEEPAK